MSPLEARVGMRVRLVFPHNPINYGAEGVIVALEPAEAGTYCANGRLEIDCDCSVHWDHDPMPAFQCTWQLEPILPDILDIPKEILQEADCPLFEFIEI